MHGSTWRREETGTSRASMCRTEPGASRRPDRPTLGLVDARNQAKDGMTREPLSSSATVRADVVRSTEPEEVPCDDRNGI
jgi:hypothetical protein